MLFNGRSLRVLESMKRQRLSRERTEFTTLCAKKGKNGRNAPGQKEMQNGPKRLTDREIRDLGGLRNATQILRDYKAANRKNDKTNSMQAGRRYRKQKKTPEERATEKEKLLNDKIENLQKHEQYHHSTGVEEDQLWFVIDGYNVLEEMVKQDGHRFDGKNLEERRDILHADVCQFSFDRGVRVCIVYDAIGNRNPDRSKSRLTIYDVDIVFCLDYEADDGLAIESEKYLRKGATEIIVVTSDIAASEACARPPEIRCQSSEIFVNEVQRCKEAFEKMMQEQKAKSRRVTLQHCLSKETLSALDELRDDLADASNERNEH